MKSRSREPKDYVRDGDDFNTRTKYAGPEVNIGDSMKVILREIYDMIERDNLQKHEIKALLNATVDEHIVEIDEVTGELS